MEKKCQWVQLPWFSYMRPANNKYRVHQIRLFRRLLSLIIVHFVIQSFHKKNVSPSLNKQLEPDDWTDRRTDRPLVVASKKGGPIFFRANRHYFSIHASRGLNRRPERLDIWQPTRDSPGHYGPKQQENNHPIIHFPTSEGESEVRERANE